jgi:hypothetical protein
MKYTINGFQQKKLLEYGLDGIDAYILRWFVDFYHTGKMAKVEYDSKTFLWVNYKAVIEDIPIINIKSKDVIARRFKKMVNCGLMEHYTKKEGGMYSCYKLVEKKYRELIEKKHPSDSKVGTPPTLKSEPSDSKVGTKDSSIKDSSIKNIYINPLKNIINTWNQQRIIVHSKQYLLNNIKKKHSDILKKNSEKEIITAIKNYKEILESDSYYFTHRWTLLDFLSRGYVKFLSETRPHERYRDHKVKEDDMPILTGIK